MGIFFVLKQKGMSFRQAILHRKFKKVVAFLNRKVNKEIERFFVGSLDKSYMFQLDFRR
ncbi:hypothetical protein HMPREF1516_1667 [Streptococcus sp. CM6]|nr:hypothetical protein HMPREF1516_1667 [Streptococcus sp. CM6]